MAYLSAANESPVPETEPPPSAETRFVNDQGVQIHYALWRPENPVAVIVLQHGLESHSGWFRELGPQLAGKGYVAAAIDRPGSGLSSGRRGDLADSGALHDNLRAVLGDLGSNLPVYGLGYSWGARWCLSEAISWPNTFRGIVLLSPGLFLRGPLSLPFRLMVAAAAAVAPRLALPTPVRRDELFTMDPKYLAFLASDSLRLSRVTARFLMQTHKMGRTIETSSRLRIPLLHLMAGRDAICDNRRNQDLLRTLVPPELYFEHVYPDAEHALVFDCERRAIAEDIDRWIRKIA